MLKLFSQNGKMYKKIAFYYGSTTIYTTRYIIKIYDLEHGTIIFDTISKLPTDCVLIKLPEQS